MAEGVLWQRSENERPKKVWREHPDAPSPAWTEPGSSCPDGRQLLLRVCFWSAALARSVKMEGSEVHILGFPRSLFIPDFLKILVAWDYWTNVSI